MHWLDLFIAGRERDERIGTLDQLDAKSAAVLHSIGHARGLVDIGTAAGLPPIYATQGGGKRAIKAANDNLAAIVERRAA